MQKITIFFFVLCFVICAFSVSYVCAADVVILNMDSSSVSTYHGFSGLLSGFLFWFILIR